MISRCAVSFVMCSCGAYRPFLRDGHFNAALSSRSVSSLIPGSPLHLTAVSRFETAKPVIPYEAGLQHAHFADEEYSMIKITHICARFALAFSALLIPMVLVGPPAYADGTPVRVRGSVVSLDGSKLIVRAKDGKDVSVSLADNFAALAVVKSSMADIKEGTFIGTATVTQPDTTLRSVEVVVFPDNLRGTAEGHYPWDLGSSSMMTNATVANAVKAVDGQTVTVTYKGGEKKIDIPANVPVVALVPASKDDIAPGAIVFVPAERQSDGALHAGAVLFGKDGVIPPM